MDLVGVLNIWVVELTVVTEKLDIFLLLLLKLLLIGTESLLLRLTTNVALNEITASLELLTLLEFSLTA